jgi:hypothetical protein
MPLCIRPLLQPESIRRLRRDFRNEPASTILFRLALAAEARGEQEQAERYLEHSSRLEEVGE